jgi:hypothetical protein
VEARAGSARVSRELEQVRANRMQAVLRRHARVGAERREQRQSSLRPMATATAPLSVTIEFCVPRASSS